MERDPKLALKNFYSSHKRLPSYSELAKLLGYKSKNAAFKVVQKLIDQGFIAKDSTGKIIPKNIFGSIRVLGLVEAGFPSPAEEDTSEGLSIDEFLIQNRESTYLLKVKGDSMINAGIHEGDLVVVERGRMPRVGDIVIADVDGEYTMKYYRQDTQGAYLEAANPRYGPIYPRSELQIAAVVTGVIRKYKY